MKKILTENKAFLIPYILIILISILILLKFDKIHIHIFINQRHSVFFDSFFKYLTWLGDGVFAIIFVLALIFIKYRYALISGISLLLTSFIIQFLKHTIYSDNLRPELFFKLNYQGSYILHIVKGAEPAHFFSFPSGHSAIAFALFFSAALFVNNKFLKFVFFIFAFLVAYSRIYLSWHFLADVITGSLIGITVSLLTYFFANKYNPEFYEKSIFKN